ncbi:MAG: hypothetical protein UV28_C0028G0003 [Candidatus Collierbacteria bacterium GW2011_GWE2_42_48]|nr:MAG: hypothetical protein UV28_C0028G0003 [Candidatus Collierbacteria bacterium GW2011_GWE2_42_48]
MFDLATNYCFSLDKDPQKGMKYFLLLHNLEKSVNGAIIEMRRLNRTRKTLLKEINDRKIRRNNNLTYLANDTYFYFICVDKVYTLLSRLASELNDPDIKNLGIKLVKTFDIKTVRNHLEHIDARCLGFLSKDDEKSKVSKPITDFGNFINDNFSFNSKQFPSGKTGLTELKNIYKELIVILKRKYANKDPHFVWREQFKKRYKAIMKTLKKSGVLNYG